MISVTAALFALAIAWGGWLASGGALFSVGSPSMGTTAPVGSLVATQPLPGRAVLHVGEIVVFQPRPGSDIIIHRIYRELPNDRYMTKGDLNPAPDIWTITRAQVIGTPRIIIPAVGWIYKLSVWFFLGGAVVIVLARVFKGPVRTWAATLGPILLLAVPFYRFRILVNGYTYGSRKVGRWLSVRLVSTGVFPARFAVPPGSPPTTRRSRSWPLFGTTPEGRLLDRRAPELTRRTAKRPGIKPCSPNDVTYDRHARSVDVAVTNTTVKHPKKSLSIAPATTSNAIYHHPPTPKTIQFSRSREPRSSGPRR